MAEPPPEDSPSLAALRPMEGLIPLIQDLPVDPSDLDFIPQSLGMLPKIDPGDTQMESKILYNSVWRIEGVAERYGGWAGLGSIGGPYQRLEDALLVLKGKIAERLSEMGFRLFPKQAAGKWADLESAVGKDSVTAVPISSDREKGAVLGLVRSGVRGEGGLVEKAQVLVSAGESEAAAVLHDALLSLVKLKPTGAKDRKDLGKSIKEMWKYLGKLLTQPDGYTFVRYAVNTLHDNDKGNRLKGSVRRTIGFLEKGGFQEITVPIGDMFDDSFSPSKYERKRVPSSRPKNTILGVARRGFMDPQGTPIQKALVEISKG